MIIKTRITEKDFINGNFILLFGKKWMKIALVFFLFYFIQAVVSSVLSPRIHVAQILIPVIAIVLLFCTTYFTSKKSFATNQMIREPIEYHVGAENLSLKGESFNSQISWEKVHKVTLQKNWLLVWHSSQSANVIPKRDISEDQLVELKGILQNRKVKNNL